MNCPELPVYFCEVQTGQVYVTLSNPQDMCRRGLISEEIIGQLISPIDLDAPLSPDNFGRNPVFVDFLHKVIKKHGPSTAGLIAAARKQGEGLVVIIDGRTPTPDGQVPPEDILGAFEVRSGEIVPDAYHPNLNHRILTKDGFFRLDSMLQESLLHELSALANLDQ